MRKNKPSLSADDMILSSKLRQMKLSGMADAFENQIQDPNADLSSFVERITEIVDAEWQLRYDKKFSRFLKTAKLRYPSADLDETIYLYKNYKFLHILTKILMSNLLHHRYYYSF